MHLITLTLSITGAIGEGLCESAEGADGAKASSGLSGEAQRLAPGWMAAHITHNMVKIGLGCFGGICCRLPLHIACHNIYLLLLVTIGVGWFTLVVPLPRSDQL